MEEMSIALDEIKEHKESEANSNSNLAVIKTE